MSRYCLRTLLCILFPCPAASTMAVVLITFMPHIYLSPNLRFGTAFRSYPLLVPL